MAETPIDKNYVWPPVDRVDDFTRAAIDSEGRPWIDGRRVNVAMYERFMAEWAAFYESAPESAGGGVQPQP